MPTVQNKHKDHRLKYKILHSFIITDKRKKKSIKSHNSGCVPNVPMRQLLINSHGPNF